MRRVIWMYWEGPMPSYIELCVRTIRARNQDVVLLDRAAFGELFRTDRDIDIDALALNHKSDFIRAYLLRNHGGLYVDADCIVLRDLGELLELAARTGFVGYREPQGYMSCNFMAARPGAEVIDAHYARVCARLRERRPLEWLDLASVPMDETIAAARPGSFALLPTHQVMPLAWNDSLELCVLRDDADHARIFRQDAYCYMLSNNTIKQHMKTRILNFMPGSELLRARYFVSFLYRKALGLPEQRLHRLAPHLGGHEDLTQMDEGALDYLITRYSVRTMVDVGCGPGGMMFYARARGLRAVGVDGDPNLARDSAFMIEHDYASKPLFLGEFDLGWAVEFLEHVEERHLPNVMETFRGCRRIFVTAAVPGQPGFHHVNCRESGYWIARFTEAGFELDGEATDGVRRHSTMWSRFTEQTGLVFRRLES